MSQPPQLETDRLILRPFEESDAAHLLVYAANPEFGQYLSYPIPTCLADVDRFIARARAGELGENLWAITRKPAPVVIGAIQLDTEDGSTLSAHYEIARWLWGQGLATEAAQAAVAWAKDNYPDIKRMVADVHPKNIGSRRVLEKLGFLAIGEADDLAQYEMRLA